MSAMEALQRAHKAWAENSLTFVCRGKRVWCARTAFCPQCGTRAHKHEFQMSLEIDT